MVFKVLLISVNYPNQFYTWAPWNREANIHISKLKNIKTEIIAPIPYSLPFKYFPYSKLTKIPLIENSKEGNVHRPRFFYPLPKRLFYGILGDIYGKSISNYVSKNIETPDLIHAHHVYPDGYGIMNLSNKWNLPLIIDIHGADSLKNWLDHNRLNRKIMETLNFSDKIICVSESLEDMILQLNIDEEKIQYVPLGVNIEKFKPRNKEKLKKELEISEKKIILFVGQLIKRKGINYLLKALTNVIESNENIEVIIIGNGPEKDNLLNLSRELNLENFVRFTGEIKGDKLAKWYSAADLFVLPSLAEGRPIVIYEAMASECAIVASNVDGIPEQVKDEYNGFLVEPKDTKTLADKLEFLLENEEIMEKMKKNSRKRIINENWTWEGYSKKIMEIYVDLLEK